MAPPTRPDLPIRQRARRKIVRTGAYNLLDDFYFSDPLPEPSLSSSSAKIVLAKSPRHAWLKHPRLNPDFEREQKPAFNLGNAAHDLFNGRTDRLAVAPADIRNWRGDNAAFKEAKWAKGLVPLLRADMKQVEGMVAALRAQIKMIPELKGVYKTGQAEVTLVWLDRGVWCKCKLDWLPKHGITFPDLKTTGPDAHPDTAQKQIYNLKYDIQAAFYCRGIRAVLGIRDPEFRFLFVETKPPHAVSLIGLTPAALAFADRDVEHALDLWRQCLDADVFPGYPNRTCFVEPPVWSENERLEAEARREEIGSVAWFKMMLEWQAPL